MTLCDFGSRSSTSYGLVRPTVGDTRSADETGRENPGRCRRTYPRLRQPIPATETSAGYGRLAHHDSYHISYVRTIVTVLGCRIVIPTASTPDRLSPGAAILAELAAATRRTDPDKWYRHFLSAYPFPIRRPYDAN